MLMTTWVTGVLGRNQLRKEKAPGAVSGRFCDRKSAGRSPNAALFVSRLTAADAAGYGGSGSQLDASGDAREKRQSDKVARRLSLLQGAVIRHSTGWLRARRECA